MRDHTALPLLTHASGRLRPLYHDSDKPRSLGQRWAMLVLKQCDSPDDLKTLKEWARFAGVSYSSLCESCRLVGLRPHDARDFARALRALIHSSIYQCQPQMLLDISDRRTLRTFVERAGHLFIRHPDIESVKPFVAQQQFIPTTNEAVKLLIELFPQSDDRF
jgi:hypothetical protein